MRRTAYRTVGRGSPQFLRPWDRMDKPLCATLCVVHYRVIYFQCYVTLRFCCVYVICIWRVVFFWHVACHFFLFFSIYCFVAAIYANKDVYTVSQKSEPPKHFATAAANLHRFKWNFTHTRHLFLSSTSNFIRNPYSVYEMFNSFKLLSQISVTDTTYFLLTPSVVTGVTSVRVDKQTTCYRKRIEF